MDTRERLRFAMKLKNITQQKLANHLGLDRASVSNMLAGKNYFTWERMVKTAEFLEINLDWLAFGRGVMQIGVYSSFNNILNKLSGRSGHDKAELEYYISVISMLEQVEQDEVYTHIISEADKIIRLVINKRTKEAFVEEYSASGSPDEPTRGDRPEWDDELEWADDYKELTEEGRKEADSKAKNNDHADKPKQKPKTPKGVPHANKTGGS
jgi:transcriptional regulator with XRE-family HTH domain